MKNIKSKFDEMHSNEFYFNNCNPVIELANKLLNDFKIPFELGIKIIEISELRRRNDLYEKCNYSQIINGEKGFEYDNTSLDEINHDN